MLHYSAPSISMCWYVVAQNDLHSGEQFKATHEAKLERDKRSRDQQRQRTQDRKEKQKQRTQKKKKDEDEY